MSPRDNAWYRLNSFANRLQGMIDEQKSYLRLVASFAFKTAPEETLRADAQKLRELATEIDELLEGVQNERARQSA